MEHQKDIIILKGSGKIFCVGGDIKELSSSAADAASFGYSILCKIYDMIANYSKPYIVLLDGLAVGGASIYSMPAKYRIVTEKTVISMPETTIGYFNDAGSSHFLSRLDNNFGLYMGMTGTKVKGFDTKKVGLATHYIESHRLDELEKSLVKCKTHKDVEKVLCHFSSADEFLPNELDRTLPNIKKCFNGSTVEEIFQNLQDDGSDWAKNALTTLKRNSPISLKVTHRSITAGKNIALRDCLKMEMRLVVNHTAGSDFKEGVRAILIDKDFKPKWSRKSIYDVTKEDVDRFFKPLPEPYELRFEENVNSKL